MKIKREDKIKQIKAGIQTCENRLILFRRLDTASCQICKTVGYGFECVNNTNYYEDFNYGCDTCRGNKWLDAYGEAMRKVEKFLKMRLRYWKGRLRRFEE